MQKNVFNYLEYSFKKLFSKEFLNIAGSSLFITIVGGILSFMVIVLSMHYYGSHPSELTLPNNGGIPFWTASALTLLIVIVTIMLVVRAWQAIVIPIRSIDPVAHLDWRGDLALFREHFWRYMGYITWYSLLTLVIGIIYVVVLIAVAAVDELLGFLFALLGGMSILYVMTTLYVAWYHALSEGSGGWGTFLESRKFIIGKTWRVFWKVLIFSLIVGIVANIIESLIYQILSWDMTGGSWDEVARSLKANQQTSPGEFLSQIFAIIQNHPVGIFGSWLLMTIIFSFSSVLTNALFHIFYVRYYLDLRDEYDSRNLTKNGV